MDQFPKFISLTITNRCNLRCWMCGQWSPEGYMHQHRDSIKKEMSLPEWTRIVDELADHQIPSLLLRGGEPFLYPQIIDLLDYIRCKGIFISIDTNGTMLERYAEDIVRIGGIHLTISVDGPPVMHDHIRGVSGTFSRLKQGVDRLLELEENLPEKISKSVNFTICQESIAGLGEMPQVTGDLGIGVIAIVPYYYFPETIGLAYETEMIRNFNCQANSWRGFHHEQSGVDLRILKEQLQKYRASLGKIYDYPYMAFTEEQYATWFQDAHTPIGCTQCNNVERLIDIQPDGSANFCVDFPDYIFGNVRENSIEELWNSQKAETFRQYRRENPRSICYRCGAKYMSEMN
jgi:MoaA/NifB/PqqE/SkfB family radical SAM enzyme